MKNFFLSVVATALFANVFAQDFRVLAGGSVGYTHNDAKSELWGTKSSSSNWSTAIQPYLMWAVADRFYLGAHGAYSRQYNITDGVKTTEWGGGAMLSYFLPVSENFFYNPMLLVGFYDIQGKVTTDPATTVNVNGWAWGTELEVASFKFKVNRFLLGINFCTISYAYVKTDARSLSLKNSSWNIDYSIAPKLSLAFIVG